MNLPAASQRLFYFSLARSVFHFNSMIKFFGLAITFKVVVAASADPTPDIALLNPSSCDRPASYLISIVGSSWPCVS